MIYYETRSKAQRAIIEAGKRLDAMGLLPASSGNLSARLESSLLITSSGKAKGELRREDLLEIDYEGKPLRSSLKPSAETLLHTQLYNFDEDIKIVLHVHSKASVILSKLFISEGAISLKNYELLKALPGVDTHKHAEAVPIFPNTQNIPQLAHDVEQFIRVNPNINAYLIEGHGMYTWGRSLKEALMKIEMFETLMQIEIEMLKIKQHEFSKNF